VRQAVTWTMTLAAVCLALSAAAGIGEARVLAERGVNVATVAAEDGSRWIQANDSLYAARTADTTAIADPQNHSLNAASIGAHLRSATLVPALLACLALAAAAVARPRTDPDASDSMASAEIIEFRRAVAPAH
jgi:hypothetical protein